MENQLNSNKNNRKNLTYGMDGKQKHNFIKSNRRKAERKKDKQNRRKKTTP